LGEQTDSKMIDYTKYITINPEQRSGKPCIRGMRITVYDVLSYMAAGDSMEEIIENFPMLTKEDILACLAYAADAERKIQLTP
jgi:uncharacterized protein (DUF433 family)